MQTSRRSPKFELVVSLVLVLIAAMLSSGTAVVSAAPVTEVGAYGELARFPQQPGPDVAAKYSSGATDVSSLTPGRFVDPVGMTVDTSDPTVPQHDGYAVYVLDCVNPQAFNGLTAETIKKVTLQYRIQKLGDHGEVLGSTDFGLASSAVEPGLHAASLAVNGASGRVYVLIADAPPVSENSEGLDHAADRILAWTTGSKGETALAPAVGLSEDKLPKDPLTGAGELVGPDALQTKSTEMVGEINGESLAIIGSGASADLALGGNLYTSLGSTVPVIERFTASGPNAGMLDSAHPRWEDAAGTEDAAAKAWGQESTELYSLSGNADGSLNVSLGTNFIRRLHADFEPNMAEISSTLQTTDPVLPWADAEEGAASGEANKDRAATIGTGQDSPEMVSPLAPTGATQGAGTLAPSAVQLAGEAEHFPGGIYAGLVASTPTADPQNPTEGMYSWRRAFGVENGSAQSLERQSNLAIRVFDAAGHSLAMIGNATSGGACNLQGGASYSGAFSQGYEGGSFIALAPGRGGVLFALAQSQLANTVVDESAQINPASPIGASSGDQIVEFAPGAGQDGAAGQSCPQPSGGFSVTNETLHGEASKGNEPITVAAGTRLRVDASEANLQGGSPWAYDWDLANGAAEGLVTSAWTPTNLFTAEPGKGNPWQWPSATAELTYAHPGSYTTKLSLVNDFGTLSAQRTINVVKAEPLTNASISVRSAAVAGEAVTFEAAATLPAFDSVADYHWDYGDGQGDDFISPQAQHVFSQGTYQVSVTIEDALGQKAVATQSLVVSAAPTKPPVTEVSSPEEHKVAGVSPPPGSSMVNTSPTDVDAQIWAKVSAAGVVSVRVSCPPGKASCSGVISLKTAGAAHKASLAGKAKRKKTVAAVALGRASFELAGASSKTVLVHLSRAGLALLRTKHSLKVTVTVSATDTGGHSKTVSQSITLRAPATKSVSKHSKHH